MDVEAYLERIGYRGPREVSAAALRGLMAAHLLATPFENLSIHWGEAIVLEEGALFEKVVRRRRGGFCYELNGLFGALLRAMGFEATMLAAEVMDGDGVWGPPFDHMALLVTLEERWLVDAGFGDSFRAPLRLDDRGAQEDGGRAYRIDMEGERYVLWQRGWNGAWQAQYRFDLTPHAFAAYEEMCRYHQTSLQSPFTQRRVCTRATGEGRVTLAEGRLIMTRHDGQRTEQAVAEEARGQALQEWFGVARERKREEVDTGG